MRRRILRAIFAGGPEGLDEIIMLLVVLAAIAGIILAIIDPAVR